jgi:hypothetical protein
MTVSVALTVAVPASAQQTWDAVTDWARQGEWMVGTKVSASGPAGIGQRLAAFTGMGRVGFLDTMEVTAWQPPARCEVLHTGRLVRGTGVFAVRSLGPDRSAFDWSEELELPLGALGRLGWPFVRPLFLAGVRRSLNRFAAWAPTR